jgi:hypothetical protein
VTKRTSILLVALLVIVGVILYLLLVGPEREGTSASDVSGAADTASGGGTGASSRERAEEGERAPSPGRSRRVGPRRVVTDAERELARALHTAVREARARSERAAGAGATSTPAPGEAPNEEARGTLDREYIRAAVQEVQPLLAECYELALEEQAGLEGSLVVEFTIEGEPDVGGVVEDPTIADTSTLRHPTLDECVRETMYTLELPAPEGSGSVTVRYPFRFSSSDEEGSEGARTNAPTREEAP